MTELYRVMSDFPDALMKDIASRYLHGDTVMLYNTMLQIFYLYGQDDYYTFMDKDFKQVYCRNNFTDETTLLVWHPKRWHIRKLKKCVKPVKYDVFLAKVELLKN